MKLMGSLVDVELLEPRLHLARPDPNPAENVFFRLPLSSDTTTHYYFDRDPAAGSAIAWNGTGQTYDGHRGTDYSGGPRGRPVFAAAPGILIAKDDGWPDFGGPPNGNYVRINHGNNRSGLPINTVYLHFEAGTVTTKPLNSFIAAGEQIGGVGTSGNSTGLHLHFESQLNRVAFDPYRAIGSNEISWWVNQGSGSPSTTAVAPKFVAGDIAEVYELSGSSLNVRAPNPTSPPIGTRNNGHTGTVLEGPVWAAFNNDFNNNLWVFYRLDWGGGLVGWSVHNWLRKAPDLIPPNVTASSFWFETSPHRLNFSFSENVQHSLSFDDLVVQNLTTGTTLPASNFSLSYNSATNVATFTYTAGVLGDATYRATLPAGSISDPAGNTLQVSYSLDFFFLNADASRDGRVTLADFNILASNFGQPGRMFSQGNFDYDPAGNVSLSDFNILAARFGALLSAGRTSAALLDGNLSHHAPRTVSFVFETEPNDEDAAAGKGVLAI